MKIVWEDGYDHEKEERLRLIRLSDSERWDYMMRLIMSNHPNYIPTNHKKRIEWTSETPSISTH